MIIKLFHTREAALRFAYPYMKRGRAIGVRRLKSKKWEARILARRQR